MKKIKNVIENLCNEVNPRREALAVIYGNKKDGHFYAIGDMEIVAMAIKNILLDGSTDKNCIQRPLAEAIMGGVYEAINSGLDPDFILEDDEEDDDNCFDCELLSVCGAKEAVKWRKALGLPKPKKHMNKREERGN